MTANNKFLVPGNWPGSTKICTCENLLAFNTEKEISEFISENCPQSQLKEKWLCAKCNHHHFLAAPPAPAGGSSGNQREYKIPTPRYRQEIKDMLKNKK